MVALCQIAAMLFMVMVAYGGLPKIRHNFYGRWRGGYVGQNKNNIYIRIKKLKLQKMIK